MHQTVAFRTAFAITRSAEDAEDVLQTGFLKAHRSLHRFRAGSAFRPWLLAIVANEARNRRRGNGRALRLVDPALVPPSLAPSAETVAVDADERRRLIAAVDRLSRDDRLAVVSRYFVGLTLEETAAALGIRPGAAKMRVGRALERLRRLLEQEAS